MLRPRSGLYMSQQVLHISDEEDGGFWYNTLKGLVSRNIRVAVMVDLVEDQERLIISVKLIPRGSSQYPYSRAVAASRFPKSCWEIPSWRVRR